MRNKIVEKLAELEQKLPKFEVLHHVSVAEAAANTRGLLRTAFYLGALAAIDQLDGSPEPIEEALRLFPMPTNQEIIDGEFGRKQ